MPDKQTALLDVRSIDVDPRPFLGTVGHVFAVFGEQTQDSGNVSYGVRAGALRFFAKTAGPPAAEAFLAHPERVALLRSAVELARSCDHPALPPLRNVIETPHGPMLLYDWADGELLSVRRELRDDPSCSYQRFRAMPVSQIVGALDTVYQVHRDLAEAGWVGEDFYDGSMIYDFEAGRLHVVDLDCYHRGPFTNTMGRMFGSSRFMAPEEFEKGAWIDQDTNVFCMGRTAALFLGDGTLDRSAFRGSQQQHAVIERACDPDRRERYATLAEFHDAWITARS